ncbi:hypothetical protein [Cesiribacter andamanensis]|uniref:Seryl-tRNA synthetase n=1 Tax=Cesiribacter andamanensis AMV16 TaxID=1279009 RepID=M7NC31_9BACT|nr:hypothetical protein [Cesiribacter andamanensis]EMR04777.1 hypothetical protein ADICEAN_00048 [Cesiribacter andamanensis AMV16]
MKITSLFLAAVFTFVSFAVQPAAAATNGNGEENKVQQMSEQEYNEAVAVLQERVEQLVEAKKNAQSQEEKKLVKKEIREVKKEAKELEEQRNGRGGFGIYIGGGALIIILLLILLL